MNITTSIIEWGVDTLSRFDPLLKLIFESILLYMVLKKPTIRFCD